jgi:hypothetical protein
MESQRLLDSPFNCLLRALELNHRSAGVLECWSAEVIRFEILDREMRICIY